MPTPLPRSARQHRFSIRVTVRLAAAISLIALLVVVLRERVPFPSRPPRQEIARPERLPLPEIVRVEVEYDDDFQRAHPSPEAFIAGAFGRVNSEWQRYRREWFHVASLRVGETGEELDASHVLARFLLGTASAPRTIHVRIVGRQLEVYSDGRGAMPVGGLAFRGSDAVVVSAPESVPEELLAYYLFHEIGHLWEAFDIPFDGGETTFGQKSRYTFDVDMGNAEILDESAGPAPRDTANLAPAIIARRLAAAGRLTDDPSILTRLVDLLLHEPSPSNPAWIAKKQALLAAVNEDVRRFIAEQEMTPSEAREASAVRRQLADHYWRANDALAREDDTTAERELAEIRTIESREVTADIRILVGAVERKLLRRRR